MNAPSRVDQDDPPPTRSLTDAEVRSEVRAIVERCAGDALRGVLLFGSRARGDYEADSDWDVAVLVQAGTDPIELRGRLIDASVEFWSDTYVRPDFVVISPDNAHHHASLILNLQDDAVSL